MTDKHLIALFIAGSLMLTLFAFFIVLYILTQKHKQNLHHLEKSKMMYDHQNKILTMQIEEQERAMEQVSKEIHDNLGQQANFAKMNVHTISMYAIDNQQISVIEETKTMLDGMIKDISNISHSLNSDFIKKIGLINMLQEALNYLNLTSEIKSNIQIIGDDKRFLPEKELLIYRIAQEAIHNVSKHAKASTVNVILTYDADAFTMAITDDGIGFEKSIDNKISGIGFLNMHNRAKLLNGTLNIYSQQLGGCRITLQLSNTHEIEIENEVDDIVNDEVIKEQPKVS